MNDLTRGERLQIMLTKEELEALDNWRFQRRMPSRAAAIRELLKRGLTAEGFALADGGSQSKDFGVTNIVVMDKQGEPILDRELVVSRNTRGTTRIYRQAEVQTLSCTPYCEKASTKNGFDDK